MPADDRLKKELEWYLRDFFFRINNSKDIDKIAGLDISKKLSKEDSQGFMSKFQIDEVTRYLRNNYLRYKNSDMYELSIIVENVMSNMEDLTVLRKENAKIIKLYSSFERKQCSTCFYINYISKNDNLKCQRCGSEKLTEFPKKTLSTNKKNCSNTIN